MLHRPNYVDYVERIQAGREKAKEDLRRKRPATVTSSKADTYRDEAISTAVDELPIALIRMQSRRLQSVVDDTRAT